jgi:DNA mismatch repair protein MutS2
VLSVAHGSISPDFGIVRGVSESRDRYFVEPHQLVEQNEQLSKIRQELEVAEQQIKYELISAVLRVVEMIDAGLDCLARLDVIFAKAAFATDFNGIIPTVQNDGRIEVRRYVHPILAIRDGKDSQDLVVPIDLHISTDQGSRALIISGPNGGGKTVALKAFGVAAILVKVAIPIPVASQTKFTPRIDFFDDILVEVGDGQSVTEGESTLMSRLNSCSRMISQVGGNSVDESYQKQTLVLLDELGGGTDPTAGAALAQAILERLLQSRNCHIVATTHSPQLKALSYESKDFHCASVLLKKDEETSSQFPTYQLEYGIIGDSYALSAASRCAPRLPEEVLSRAAELMSTLTSSSNNGNGDYMRALSDSLEKQLDTATVAAVKSEQTARDLISIRKAMISLASNYDQHLKSLEQRLERCYQELRSDPEATSLEVVGTSLAEVGLTRKKVKSEEDLLRERGLKLAPETYKFSEGESVVLVGGDFDGAIAKIATEAISASLSLEPGCVAVLPSVESWGSFSPDDDTSLGSSQSSANPLVLKRHQVAIWDYDSIWEDEDDDHRVERTSVKDKKMRLSILLSNLKSSSSPVARSTQEGSNNPYKSSRERKAATKVSKRGRRRK